MNLKELFDIRILERGRDYCKHGLVTDLHRDGNIITASVAGSEDYEVIITLENGEPTNLYCSCPYAADGHNCKHMAAVLLAYDEKTESAALHAARISAPTGLHLDRNTGEINIAAYRQRIKATIRQFSDRHGFIDYDSAPDLRIYQNSNTVIHTNYVSYVQRACQGTYNRCEESIPNLV